MQPKLNKNTHNSYLTAKNSIKRLSIIKDIISTSKADIAAKRLKLSP